MQIAGESNVIAYYMFFSAYIIYTSSYLYFGTLSK